MFRDRLKRAARRAAIKVLKMDFDTEERKAETLRPEGGPTYDASKIPKLVDGDGDTPGPNHKEDIGRTWVAAQLAGGVAPVFVDLRPPQECIAGVLPGAMVLPGDLVFSHLDRLPDPGVRVTVYDQTGELGSESVAARLREAGWTLARRLQGGYAEWIEHDEPVELPTAPAGSPVKVGDSVRLPDGRQAWVLDVQGDGETPQVTAWLSDGTTAGPLPADQLEA